MFILFNKYNKILNKTLLNPDSNPSFALLINVAFMTQMEFNFKVREQYQPLKGYAFKLTQDSEEANDLVQETMLKAFCNKDKFMEGTNLKGWLYTIMKNIFINSYRRFVNGGILPESKVNPHVLLQYSGRVENDGEAKLMMREIKNAISALTENLRTPFLMSFEGYKYEEIAHQLAVPLGTVKIRIHTARQKLKASLHDYSSGSIAH